MAAAGERWRISFIRVLDVAGVLVYGCISFS
jgi:hypothetical protein